MITLSDIISVLSFMITVFGIGYALGRDRDK